MRILVLGGTGFVSAYAVRHLAQWGHEVTIFHRGRMEVDLPESVTHLHGDREDLTSYRTTFEEIAPDVVVTMLIENVRQAHVFMDTFNGMAKRAVVMSSVNVYRACGRIWRTEPGPPDLVPILEDDPLREKSLVNGEAEDKVHIERIVSGTPSFPATILRLPAVLYGPGNRQEASRVMLDPIRDGRPVILLPQTFADWRWPIGYSEDIGYAVALAAKNKKAEGRVYNVADAVALTHADFQRAIGRAAGWSGQVMALPEGKFPASMTEGLNVEQQWIVDTSRLRQELGYTEQVPFNEAMRRTVEWEQANPPPDMPDPSRNAIYEIEDAILAGLEAEQNND